MAEEKRKLIKYPVKIGFEDGSGKKENWITDSEDKVLVHGWGDCCKLGGIQQKNVAKYIVKLLNKEKPKIMLEEAKE